MINLILNKGDTGIAKTELKPDEQVYLKGEIWSAECIEGYYAVKDEKVKVVKIERVHLIVCLLDNED
ncbi:MAG: NfeD family protein [Promethearchaeota archaeon]